METKSGIILPGSFDLMAEVSEAEKLSAQEIAVGHLGLCWDCPLPAIGGCPDGVARCEGCMAIFARQIVEKADEARRYVHRLSPKAQKARVKRRKARKAKR